MSTVTTQPAAPTIPAFAHVIVKALLRTPLHVFISHNTMLISFMGRKSGKQYTIPISYVRDGDMITCFTPAGWWKNLRGSAPVTLLVKGREIKGIAEPIVDNKEAIARGLLALLKSSPRDAKYRRVALDAQGRPNPDHVARAAQTDVMIQVRIMNEV